MSEIVALFNSAKVTWQQRRAAAQARRARHGKHRLEDALYYGNLASSIVLRLRQERGVGLFQRMHDNTETLVLAR